MPLIRLQLLLVVVATLTIACASKSVQLPGNTMADQVLQRDAAQFVMLLESAEQSRCAQRKIINTEVKEPPADAGKDTWVERWTVDRCGSLVYYKVTFTPSPGGGTDVAVTLWE
jgi:hypothetical protein